MLRKAGRHGLAATLLLGCALAALAQPPLPTPSRAGDLIFRTGTEGISQAVLAVDQGSYSHVGMLVGGPEHWQVLHATPAERPDARDAVVLDTLDFFLAPERAHAFAVFHLPTATPLQRQHAVTWALAQQGRPFHILDNQQGTYCTTLVWKAWQQAGLDLQVQFTSVQLPLLSGRYLLPSALAASPLLQRLQMP